MNFFAIKFKKENLKTVERVVMGAMIDRHTLCKLEAIIAIGNNNDFYYLIISGYTISVKCVLAWTSRVLSSKNIAHKKYECSEENNTELYRMIIELSEDVSIVKNYYSENLQNQYAILRTKYLLENGVFSNLTFCPHCDGYGRVNTVSSVVGYYTCECCNNLIKVPGPIVSRKKLEKIRHITQIEIELLAEQYNTDKYYEYHSDLSNVLNKECVQLDNPILQPSNIDTEPQSSSVTLSEEEHSTRVSEENNAAQNDSYTDFKDIQSAIQMCWDNLGIAINNEARSRRRRSLTRLLLANTVDTTECVLEQIALRLNL